MNTTKRNALLVALICFGIAAGCYRADSFWGLVTAAFIGVWALFLVLPTMDGIWRFKAGGALAVVLLAGLALWPTVSSMSGGKVKVPQYIKDRVPFGIAKGLDLQGGMRLVYTVEVDEAIADKRSNGAEEMRQKLAVAFGFHKGDNRISREEMLKLEEKVRILTPETAVIRLKFKDKADVAKVDERFKNDFVHEMAFKPGPADDEVTFKIRTEVETQIRERAVSQAKDTVAKRVDELGLKETGVATRDEDIIVEVPGQNEKAFAEIRDIIRRTARLEFKMVDDTTDFFGRVDAKSIPESESIELRQESAPDGLQGKKELNKSVTYARIMMREKESLDECKTRFKRWVDTLGVPDDRQVGFGVESDRGENGQSRDVGWRTYYMFKRAELTGEHVTDAQTQTDNRQGALQYIVQLTLSPVGAERFEEVTGANVNRRFAIILDDKVDSTPRIMTKIAGGRPVITMGGSDPDVQLENARKLEMVLRSGALPAQITLTNESVIGPSLGQDSIDKGLKGMLAGGTLVLLFMILYYRSAGFIADIAVLLNLFLQLAFLASVSATMTLPGICGLALTIGIAIDANVLINERIREELRAGRSIRAAVDAGYDKAFSAIIDGHVTVFISGLILMQYGSGPVKGFAVTLVVGIVASLFTGVFCTRLVFDWWARGRKAQRLDIGAEF